MTYEEAREFIDQANQYGGVLGLEAITELLNRLGNPQEQLNIIHVAGTNGKGSTGAFLTAILNQAGYRVGRYISPTVFSYRERIQISYKANTDYRESGREKYNGSRLECSYESTKQVIAYIPREGVCQAIELIKPTCESMVREGHPHPTTFEIETVMTFLYFLWEKVDFVVLEVGMGGRLDATNVFKKPVCSVITSISMDHMQYLGDTLEKIATEKAGIIKAGCSVVTCEQEPEVLRVLRSKAAETGSDLYLADSGRTVDITYSIEGTVFNYHSAIDDGNGDNLHNRCSENYGEACASSYRIHLLGAHQVKNAILAIEVARVLKKSGYNISEETIKAGLLTARWSGRFELLSTKPYLVIDGAHNEDAAIRLREAVEIYFAKHKIFFIMGVLADKEYRSILRITAPLADTIYTLTPENPRALSSNQLAEEAGKYCDRVIDAGNIAHALKLAYAEAGEEDVIIAFGSLSFLGDLVRSAAPEINRKDDVK